MGWESDLVRGLHEKHSTGYLTTIDGKTRLHLPAIDNGHRKLIGIGGILHDFAETLDNAKDAAKGVAKRLPYTKPTYGYVVEWLSELGKTDELSSLLRFTDVDFNQPNMARRRPVLSSPR